MRFPILASAAVLVAACIPGFADDASFYTAARMTFTVPTSLPGITYAVNNELPQGTGPGTSGDASISYGGESWSWKNGVLSYNFPASSGKAHSTGVPSFHNISAFDSEYDTQFMITNSNSHAVRVPFTEWLSFEGSSTQHGATASAYTQAYLDVFDQSVYSLNPDGFDIEVICENNPGNCQTLTSLSGFHWVKGPITSSPISNPSSFLVPADSTAILWVVPESGAYAQVVNPVPEPSTLALLGTGLTGLFGILTRLRREKQTQA